MYWVHSNKGEDPTDPWRSTDYPFPGVPHEGAMARLVEAHQRSKVCTLFRPRKHWTVDRAAACVLCETCDSFACMVDAKGDADVAAVRPALSAESKNVRLLTNAEVTTAGHRRSRARSHRRADHCTRVSRITVRAKRFVVACGAVNTAALLLRSASATHPRGLANSSDQAGPKLHGARHDVLSRHRPAPQERSDLPEDDRNQRLVHRRPIEQVSAGQCSGAGQAEAGRRPRWVSPGCRCPSSTEVTKYTLDLFLQTEDLPLAENRVALNSGGQITLTRRETNLVAHHELINRMKKVVRKAGFPVVLTRSLGVEATSHQCGTARMGEDPATSVVDPDLRAHDLDNLWIADSSPFPSSAAVNPAITVAALALRLGRSGVLTA